MSSADWTGSTRSSQVAGAVEELRRSSEAVDSAPGSVTRRKISFRGACDDFDELCGTCPKLVSRDSADPPCESKVHTGNSSQQLEWTQHRTTSVLRCGHADLSCAKLNYDADAKQQHAKHSRDPRGSTGIRKACRPRCCSTGTWDRPARCHGATTCDVASCSWHPACHAWRRADARLMMNLSRTCARWCRGWRNSPSLSLVRGWRAIGQARCFRRRYWRRCRCLAVTRRNRIGG